MDMIHPDIDKMNRDGFLGNAEECVAFCARCQEAIARGAIVFELNERTFCDEECLVEAFTDDPCAFGAEQVEL